MAVRSDSEGVLEADQRGGRKKEMRLLNNMRAPLIAGVLLVHCNVLQFLPPEQAPITLYRSITNVIIDMLYVTVPAFFFISGFFFFRSGLPDAHSLRYKLKRRFRTLVLPYLLWNIIGLCLTFVKTIPPLDRSFPQYAGFFDSWSNILMGFIAMPMTQEPYDFPLWFIRNLIFVILLTPLLTVCFRYMKGWLLLPLIILMIYFPEFALELIPSVWFFALGASMALYGHRFRQITGQTLILTILFVLLTAGYNYFPEQIPQRVAQTVGVFLLCSISARLTERFGLFPSWLTGGVFFVFACHGLYCTVIDKAALAIFSPVNNVPKAAFAYAVAFLMNLGLTISFYLILRKFFPRLTDLLCGNR